jgi:hypothetical protein
MKTRDSTIYFAVGIVVIVAASMREYKVTNDPETFIWWIVPLLSTIAGAVYSARRDHTQWQDHEERLRRLEALEAHRQGSESATGSGSSDGPDLSSMEFRIATNTQAIGVLEERVAGIEKRKR